MHVSTSITHQLFSSTKSVPPHRFLLRANQLSQAQLKQASKQQTLPFPHNGESTRKSQTRTELYISLPTKIRDLHTYTISPVEQSRAKQSRPTLRNGNRSNRTNGTHETMLTFHARERETRAPGLDQPCSVPAELLEFWANQRWCCWILVGER